MAQSIDRLVHLVEDHIPVVHSFLETKRLRAQAERDSYVALAFTPTPLPEDARESYRRKKMDYEFSLRANTRGAITDPDYISASNSLAASAMHREMDQLNALDLPELDAEIQADAHSWLRTHPLKTKSS